MKREEFVEDLKNAKSALHPLNCIDAYLTNGEELAEEFKIPECVKKQSLGHILKRIVPTSIREEFDFTRTAKALVITNRGAQTRWHIDPTGSSVLFAPLLGEKHFFTLDVTERNLAIYGALEYLSEVDQL